MIYDIFADRTKNPGKSLLLSVLPAIAKKSYIDVGKMPCNGKGEAYYESFHCKYRIPAIIDCTQPFST